jgi:hypothetical protein
VLLGRFDERDLRIHGAHNRNKLNRHPDRSVTHVPVCGVTHVSGPYQRAC